MASTFIAQAAPASAREYNLHILHGFCSEPNCRDGKWAGDLVSDATGNLYGTTTYGGFVGVGTIFELSRAANGNGWSYRVLHDFCTETRCRDGSFVDGPLVVDRAGAIYGVATVGGDSGYGVIFKLSPPNTERPLWRYQVLTEICPAPSDYCEPISFINYGLTYAGAAAGALYDGTSPLYGTSFLGGLDGSGTVFSVTPPRPGRSRWHFKVIYDFCSQTECGDGGELPGANVVVDAAGNLFGTTTAGGVNGEGVLFELQKKKRAWTETALYNFCSQPNCTDGEAPGSLTQDLAGDLIGTSSASHNLCQCGLLFRFTSGASWTEQVLHHFCRRAECRDGSLPTGLALAPGSDLFGVTQRGGGHDIDQYGEGGGTIFRLGSSFDVLRRFCSEPDCADGEYPDPSVVVDPAGNVFGTTSQGGPHGDGEVFELSP
ncbi:MAG TPA: choice-of-anchor tandem repeat GloVer-containing protein [Rhizomicrobium sp.]